MMIDKRSELYDRVGIKKGWIIERLIFFFLKLNADKKKKK